MILQATQLETVMAVEIVMEVVQQCIFRPIKSIFNATRFDGDIFSHASAKKKTEPVKAFKLCSLSVVFKWNHGTEGVNIRP